MANKMRSDKSVAIVLGLTSALFFAVTFVFNRIMAVQGGHWIWGASMRFFWMAPLLLLPVFFGKKLKPLLIELKRNPFQWMLWSTVGFGFFYAPLTFAAAYGPSWLVASTWQVTIVAGMFVAPIINKKSFRNSISKQVLLFSGIILLGIVIMQLNQAKSINSNDLLLGIVPVIFAAFAYPIGNRKMMRLTAGKLNALQRTLGMTLASLPFWIFLSCIGLGIDEYPQSSQVLQTLVVAICSGVIATVLFFMATDRVSNDETALASVEATQSAEVLFALVGEVIVLKIELPDYYAMAGISLVIIGMLLHSLVKERPKVNSGKIV